MTTFIFRCPCTGWNVQAHTEDNCKSSNTFEVIACIACQQLHLVNPETSRVAGEDDDWDFIADAARNCTAIAILSALSALMPSQFSAVFAEFGVAPIGLLAKRVRSPFGSW